jgi:hypothetical protein
MTNVSSSVTSVITPAGVDNAVGLISTGYLKDPTDHQWDSDSGTKEWRAFMAKNMPGADLSDNNYVYACAASKLMLPVLQQCNGNFSRENVMKQAESVHDLVLPDDTAGHQGEHQPHRSGDAVGTVQQQDLAAVRRHHRGGFLTLAPYAEPRSAVHALGQQSDRGRRCLIPRRLRDQQRLGSNTARSTQPCDCWCQQFAAIRRIQEDQAGGFTSRSGQRIDREDLAAILRAAGSDVGAQCGECGAVILDERRTRSAA